MVNRERKVGVAIAVGFQIHRVQGAPRVGKRIRWVVHVVVAHSSVLLAKVKRGGWALAADCAGQQGEGHHHAHVRKHFGVGVYVAKVVGVVVRLSRARLRIRVVLANNTGVPHVGVFKVVEIAIAPVRRYALMLQGKIVAIWAGTVVDAHRNRLRKLAGQNVHDWIVERRRVDKLAVDHL